MKKLIIIPAYNEEKNIETLLNKLDKEYPEYDYVVINDCSTDCTKNILLNRKANFVDLPVNLGIGGGVQTGYMYALEKDYDIAIQMDGDGQHLPEYLDTIVSPIESGQADIVIGSRFISIEGFQSSVMRRLGIKILSCLIKILTNLKIKDVTSGFRAINKKTIQLFANNYAQDYPEPEAIVLGALNGLRTLEVPVKMQERVGGKSSINGLKSIYYMIKVSLSLFMVCAGNKKRSKK